MGQSDFATAALSSKLVAKCALQEPLHAPHGPFLQYHRPGAEIVVTLSLTAERHYRTARHCGGTTLRLQYMRSAWKGWNSLSERRGVGVQSSLDLSASARLAIVVLDKGLHKTLPLLITDTRLPDNYTRSPMCCAIWPWSWRMLISSGRRRTRSVDLFLERFQKMQLKALKIEEHLCFWLKMTANFTS